MSYLKGVMLIFWGVVLSFLIVLIVFVPQNSPLRGLLNHGKTRVLKRTIEPSILSQFLNMSVSKCYFAHFYIFGIVWHICVVAWFVHLIVTTPGNLCSVMLKRECLFSISLVMISYFLHILRRALETIPMINGSVVNLKHGEMHICHYCYGMLFYFAMPLTYIAHPELTQEIFDTKENASCKFIMYELIYSVQIKHVLGILMFFYASVHQYRCHRILYNMKKSMIIKRVERGYKKCSLFYDIQDQETKMSIQSNTLSKIVYNKYAIPFGDWFSLVSNPHFLAEILIYLSLAVISPGNLCVWLALASVICNLTCSAAQNHTWYKNTFKELYPKHRRALVPLIF